MSGRLEKILKISVFKTLYFNAKYFWRQQKRICFPVLVARNFKLKSCCGNLQCESMRPFNVTFGFNEVAICDCKFERGIWNNAGDIILGENVSFGEGVRIDNHGSIKIGTKTGIMANSNVICYDSIEIGDNCIISWGCQIMDTDLHKIYDNQNNRINENCPISIGNSVWVGSRVIVLKGSDIPNGSICAAGAIISKRFEEHNIIIGGTNKILNKNIRWEY